MYVCIYACAYVLMCVCVRTCACVNVCVHVCACACVCIYACACVCVRVSMRACVCVYTHRRAHLHMGRQVQQRIPMQGRSRLCTRFQCSQRVLQPGAYALQAGCGNTACCWTFLLLQL